MGTVSNLTFVSGGPGVDKTFYATYAPAAGEGYHVASARDVTGNYGLGQIDTDYVAKRVTVTHDWEPGREYEIKVNFSYGVPKSGIAPGRVSAGSGGDNRMEKAVAAGANGTAPKPKSVRVANRKVKALKAPKASKAPEPETKDS